jgi:hypothetical protein
MKGARTVSITTMSIKTFRVSAFKITKIVIMTFSIAALSITVTNAKLSIILSVVILNFTALSVVYIVYQCQTHQGPYSQHFIFFAPNKLCVLKLCNVML